MTSLPVVVALIVYRIVWIMCCLTLIEDGLYLDWYGSGPSFKSTTFTTYRQIGVPIRIPLCGIVCNDCFRLHHFIAQNCAIIANKGAIKSWRKYADLRATKLFFHLKINNFNCDIRFMQQIQEWNGSFGKL